MRICPNLTLHARHLMVCARCIIFGYHAKQGQGARPGAIHVSNPCHPVMQHASKMDNLVNYRVSPLKQGPLHTTRLQQLDSRGCVLTVDYSVACTVKCMIREYVSEPLARLQPLPARSTTILSLCHIESCKLSLTTMVVQYTTDSEQT